LKWPIILFWKKGFGGLHLGVKLIKRYILERGEFKSQGGKRQIIGLPGGRNDFLVFQKRGARGKTKRTQEFAGALYKTDM